MRSLVAVALGHALLAAGWAAMARSFARRDAFDRSPLRRPALVAVAGLTAAAWAVVAGFTGAVEAWMTTLASGPDWPPTLATAATFCGPVAATAAATHLAGGGDARRFALGYGLLVGPALALTLTAPLLPTGWWLVGAVVLLGAGMASAPPVVVPRVAPTRPLTATERAALARLLDDGADHDGTATTPAGVRIRVLALGPSGPATAGAAGVLPVAGGRVVFVTERVFAALPPAEAAAVVAHELGHHRRRHVPLRLGAAGVLLLPWLAATAAEVPGAFLGGLALAIPGLLALLWLVRWTEFDADRQAASAVGREPMARALERLSAGGALRDGGGPLSLHPATGDRVRRLRDGDADGPPGERVPGDD